MAQSCGQEELSELGYGCDPQREWMLKGWGGNEKEGALEQEKGWCWFSGSRGGGQDLEISHLSNMQWRPAPHSYPLDAPGQQPRAEAH